MISFLEKKSGIFFSDRYNNNITCKLEEQE